MTTALQVAMARSEALEAIPAIDSHMGRSWIQPSRTDIQLDDSFALMTRATFEKLAEYSGTFPTGVYPGKMWKRNDGLFDPTCNKADRRWLLCWFGISNKGPGYCSNNFREILLSDGELPQ